MLLLRQHRIQPNIVFEQPAKICWASVQLKVAGLDRRDVEEVGDQVQHKLARAFDDGEEFYCSLFSTLPASSRKNSLEQKDDANGVAQVVRRHPQETELQSVQAFEFEILFGEFALGVGKLVIQASQLPL